MCPLSALAVDNSRAMEVLVDNSPSMVVLAAGPGGAIGGHGGFPIVGFSENRSFPNQCQTRALDNGRGRFGDGNFRG